MTTPPLQLHAPTTDVAGLSSTLVLHSHHYHAALLRALYEAEELDSDGILRQAIRSCGVRVGPAHSSASAQERRRALESIFRERGIGRLDLEGIDSAGVGCARLADSHSVAAWSRRYPRASQPVCGIAAAMLGELLSEAEQRPLQVVEASCVAMGADECTFKVVAGGEGAAKVRKRAHPSWEEEVSYDGPEASSGVQPMEWQEGVGGPFGGGGAPFIALAPEFYATVCQLFATEVPRLRGAKFGNLPGILLLEAAHRNGFHLFGEVLQSAAWHERVLPGITCERDRLEALLEWPGKLGWGYWRIHSFVPGERLIIRIRDAYEAVGHERLFGRSREPRCTVARGASAAIMNLLDRADTDATAALSPSSYNALFRSPRSFRAVETSCRVQGGDFCELVVNPLTV